MWVVKVLSLHNCPRNLIDLYKPVLNSTYLSSCVSTISWEQNMTTKHHSSTIYTTPLGTDQFPNNTRQTSTRKKKNNHKTFPLTIIICIRYRNNHSFYDFIIIVRMIIIVLKLLYEAFEEENNANYQLGLCLIKDGPVSSSTVVFSHLNVIFFSYNPLWMPQL